MGEIGGNDYNYAFFQEASINQAMNYVPQVVQAIIDAAKVKRFHAFQFTARMEGETEFAKIKYYIKLPIV